MSSSAGELFARIRLRVRAVLCCWLVLCFVGLRSCRLVATWFMLDGRSFLFIFLFGVDAVVGARVMCGKCPTSLCIWF